MRTVSIVIIALAYGLQTYSQKNFCEGYIITLNNDTIMGKVRDYFPLKSVYAPKKISFIDKSGSKTNYLPDELNGYSKANIANYLALDLGYGKDFAKIIIDGYVSLLSITTTTKFNSNALGGSDKVTENLYTETFYLYIKKERKVVLVSRSGFKTSMADFFSEYPKLKEMILKKELRYADIEIIVEMYNNWKKESSAWNGE